MIANLVQLATLGAILPAPSALLILVVGLAVARRLPERRVHLLVAWSMSIAVVLSSAVVVALGLGLASTEVIDLGPVLHLRGYHLDLAFRVDLPGAIFLWLTHLLCGLVGAFSAQYLHQDEGYHRFYGLLLAFVVGLSLISVGAGLDLVFAGWELLGIASALLIGFFHRRPAPVHNGLRAYAVYRTTDVGIVLALVLLHRATHTASLDALATLGGTTGLIIAAALTFGAMGKGAIVPFTAWLPRAMEGPTPSSAIFYGALSVHASPFLLLRAFPLLEDQIEVRVAVGLLGLATAFHANAVGRTQADVKSSLGYASVTQVGVIWIEIALGATTLALLHIVGHAILRTWQLLRAPSLLHDRHTLMQDLGRAPPERGRAYEWVLPLGFRRWLYRIALERWYLDELHEGALRRATAPFRQLDRLDQRWARFLDGAPAASSSSPPPEAQHP